MLAQILAMVAAARAELKPFAEESAPTVRGPVMEYLLGLFVMFIYMCRVPLSHCRVPHKFYHQLTQLGGAERLALLLAVAKFDKHRDGTISAEEREEFDRQAAKLCSEFVAGLPNLTVACSIIIGATHMHSMGRPRPWGAEGDFADNYGLGSAQMLLWLAYGTNVVLQTTAVTVMVNAYWYRLLMTTYTTRPAERICFLLRSNAIGLIANLTALLFFSILMLVGFAGMLNQGVEGWLAVGALPVGTTVVAYTLMGSITQAHRRMHAEARRVLRNSVDTPDRGSQIWSTQRATVHPAYDSASDAVTDPCPVLSCPEA